MAFGESIPPFCFPKTASGIEVDVFREALALGGYTLVPRFYPFARVPLAFRQGEVDAAMTDLGQNLTDAGGHYGDTAVIYDNVLITRTDRQLVLRRPSDLAGLQIVSFPGALRRFPEWLQASSQAGRYREIGDQVLHVRMLMLGHCDVVLSDRTIFRYFAVQESRNPKGVALVPVTQHVFTQPKPDDYRPVFRSPAVRDAFNDGLRQLKTSGRYRAIFDRYLKA